eukprot:scaffold849_cov386-Prasinococcus_capsulatus_cf.AAC.9
MKNMLDSVLPGRSYGVPTPGGHMTSRPTRTAGPGRPGRVFCTWVTVAQQQYERAYISSTCR